MHKSEYKLLKKKSKTKKKKKPKKKTPKKQNKNKNKTKKKNWKMLKIYFRFNEPYAQHNSCFYFQHLLLSSKILGAAEMGSQRHGQRKIQI